MSLNERGQPQYLKMRTAGDLSGETIVKFALGCIAAGSSISTDAYAAYTKLSGRGFVHEPAVFNPKENKDHLKWLHTMISNAKALIGGTFHGIDRKHLPLYLAEFCYRFNRRFWPGEIFNRLLSSCTMSEKTSYAVLTT